MNIPPTVAVNHNRTRRAKRHNPAALLTHRLSILIEGGPRTRGRKKARGNVTGVRPRVLRVIRMLGYILHPSCTESAARFSATSGFLFANWVRDGFKDLSYIGLHVRRRRLSSWLSIEQ